MENKYGFIYVTTNNVNGKKYIGQKKFDHQYKWKSYLGSGVHLKNAIEKYGKENFTREIIDYADTPNKLNELEKYYIEKYNAVKSNRFYNMIEGGDVSVSLGNKNSVPIVNIDTGFVFKSIKDASAWSGYGEATIVKSFDYRHDYNHRVEELIFKRLSDLKMYHIFCACCASNTLPREDSNLCDDCYDIIEDKSRFEVFVASKVVNYYGYCSDWVLEFLRNNKIKKSKKKKGYLILKRNYGLSVNKKKWIKTPDKYYRM